MHATGWLLIVFCIVLGIRASGLRLGVVVGIAFATSLLLHEIGHMLAAILLRVPVREVGLCLSGAYNRRAYARCRRDEILISAAGPLINLAVVFPLIFVPMVGKQIALCNLLVCIGNLVPIPSSDGLRILRTIWPSGKGAQVISIRSDAESRRQAA